MEFIPFKETTMMLNGETYIVCQQEHHILRQRRLEMNLTQAQVAEHLEMSPNNLNAKLNGRVPFTVPEVVDIRETFMPDATLDYLLSTN